MSKSPHDDGFIQAVILWLICFEWGEYLGNPKMSFPRYYSLTGNTRGNTVQKYYFSLLSVTVGFSFVTSINLSTGSWQLPWPSFFLTQTSHRNCKTLQYLLLFPPANGDDFKHSPCHWKQWRLSWLPSSHVAWICVLIFHSQHRAGRELRALLGSVSVSSSCHNKVAQVGGGRVNNRCLFFTVVEAGSPGSRCLQS